MKVLQDATTGEISKMFDPEEVALIELSDCGREVWATLRCGIRFLMFELRASSNIDSQTFLEGVAKSYSKNKEDS